MRAFRVLAAPFLAAALLAAAPAFAQTPAAPGAYPQLVGEVDMGFYGIGTWHSGEGRRDGTQGFLFGEIANGLHFTPNFSIQSVIHVEPVGEGEPNGGTIGFRRQGASLEALFADWRPAETLALYAGKFTAPFGRGHHDFPGVLTAIRAHETYMAGESLGFGGSWTFLSDPVLGEHDLSAAVFTLDTSFLSNTLITRRRCCVEGYERFERNTRQQGGPGNTGRLDNFAIALDGDGFGWLPNFSYHLAVMSRGAGQDGASREWGYAAGLRYEARWTPELRTLFFAEAVEFRNAGGRPRTEVETEIGLDEAGEPILETAEVAVSERRRFTTLGARTVWGPWRGTLAWQRDQRKNALSATPTENYVEVSVGREIGWGFGADLGYQFARYAREEGGRGSSNAVVGVLRYRLEF